MICFPFAASTLGAHLITQLSDSVPPDVKYIIDFDTAWYRPQTFHQDIRNAGIDYYVTPVFRVDYGVESGYNMAVDADSTCVVHAKDGCYTRYLAPYHIIGASGVDEI